jgi:predicted DNA binding CopG/RHH family protein
MSIMNGRTHLAAWVSVETKQRFSAMAQQLGLTESALLKRMVDLTLQGTRVADTAFPTPPEKVARDARLYVRLRPDDRMLLRERATARGMPAATYVSMLVRAHLHAIAPLPDRELAELERAVTGLGAVGRNLNHIARVALQTASAGGVSVTDLMSLLRACEALRAHVKGLITANNRAWETGSAEASR